MSLKTIKTLFITGMTIVIIASVLEVFFIQDSWNLLFYMSMVGHVIFAVGLWLMDKIASSPLCRYYIAMMAIGCSLHYLQSYEINALVVMILALFLLFLVFKYLDIFTKVSGEHLFINSFYCFIICSIIGFCILKFSNIVEYSSTRTFIIGFMIFPAFIVYIAAILNLRSINSL
ncbi:hypothetical protein LS73_003840 [Helicobacter muridarum]|uniref:Uncharacterized protein n=1 Tax=Helicobacter muridarum TaxID=216 RepID=A0A099TZ62_9HELI|nr:hypothetical protein [Helicobacter muridarum]TLE00790.1 hypothetical protein LS73_003840 [Helicobacter muridarum]STQ86524.1 Uncharacterised protein [Helicobacter muridarum]